MSAPKPQYLVVTQQQFQQGYVVLAGDTLVDLPFTRVGERPDGNVVVLDPRSQGRPAWREDRPYHFGDTP